MAPKLRLAAVAAFALSMTCPPAARAITYGVRDGGEHPYVGFLLFYVPEEAGWFSCTGSLLDPTTVLTAGHCTSGIGTSGVPTPGGSGGDDVWTSFDEVVDLDGFPKRADYPDDEAALFAARAAWLDANPRFTRGTSHPNPLYDDFADSPANHDVGVVVLVGAAPVASFATLAPLGSLDALASSGKGHSQILIETAGYGIQEVRPRELALDERWKATSRIVNLKSALNGGFNLQSSNNPSAAGGAGGSCFGDSGGGVFLDDTNVLVGVVSFGLNDNCKGADFSARADIADTQDFVLPFLGQ